MLIERRNLETELQNYRAKEKNENDFLAEVKAFLQQDDQTRDAIKDKIKGTSSTNQNNFNFDLLDTTKIYHVQQIKEICIDYRLRFLDSSFFKNDIPEEAISKIKYLEKDHNTNLNGFKIMAPSKLFQLKNYDDPLMFAPIGNDYYYLIHKWGNDINPFRKIAVRPFRDFSSLLVFLFAISALLAWVTPGNVFGEGNEDLFKVVCCLFIFKSLSAIALYFSFWKGKNFNTEIWNSTFYN
ncbi:MAG: hypothetical protein H7174_13485 [Flavobacterium sp.]|nr:hypothetical protein [Flavobacterium sp.]